MSFPVVASRVVRAQLILRVLSAVSPELWPGPGGTGRDREWLESLRPVGEPAVATGQPARIWGGGEWAGGEVHMTSLYRMNAWGRT